MAAAPVVHQILFFLSTLFGINTPMIGQEAVVDIHLAEQTGSITYKNVITSEEHAHQAKEALEQLQEASLFDKRIHFMSLEGQTITVEEESLQVKMMFRYENEQVLLERLGFYKKKQGAIIYEILDKETYLASNGEQQEELVKWPAATPDIHLEISGTPLDADEKEASVSLARYWED